MSKMVSPAAAKLPGGPQEAQARMGQTRAGRVRYYGRNAGGPRPAAELKAFLDRTGAWYASGGVLGDRPLAVLSVTEQAIYSEVLTKLQAELPAQIAARQA